LKIPIFIERLGIERPGKAVTEGIGTRHDGFSAAVRPPLNASGWRVPITLAAILALAGCSESASTVSQPSPASAEYGEPPVVEHYDPADQIEQLRQLHAKGLITDDEFETKKRRLLERR